MLFCEVSYANIAYRYMLVGIQVVAIPSIVIAYAIDSYKSLPGEVSTRRCFYSSSDLSE